MDKLSVITDIAIVARNQRLLLDQLNSVSTEELDDIEFKKEFYNNRLQMEKLLESLDSLVEGLLKQHSSDH